jgi:hypothetical protein
MLYAFDLLELDGEDLRPLPLADRKKRLARLLGGRRLGIVLSDHTDDDGATIFRQACVMGLRGDRVKAADRALSVGPLAGLAQGEEPGQPGDDPGAGSGMVTWSGSPNTNPIMFRGVMTVLPPRELRLRLLLEERSQLAPISRYRAAPGGLARP